MTVSSLPARLWREVGVYAVVIRHFRRNVRLYLFSILLMGPGLQIYALLYNLYLLELGFDEAFVGQVVALYFLGIVAGSVPAGMLYTRRGGRLSLAVGVVLAAMMQAVQLFLRTPLTLLLAAFFAGIGFSIIPTAAHPFLADESNPDERTYLFSTNAMTWNATEVIGSLIGGLLPGLFGTLLSLSHAADLQRASIFAGAAITLLALIPISMMKPGHRLQPAAEATPVAPSDVVPRTPWRGFIGGGLMVFFLGLTMGATMPFYNVYFSQFHRANAAQVGWLISLSRIVGILSISPLPTIVSRLGKVRTNLFLGIAAAPFLLLLGLPLPLGLAIFPFLLGYALFRANSILFFNLAMEVVSPRMRGTQGSVRVFFNFGGRALAGVLGGILIVRTGYGGLFTLAAIASLTAGLVAWLFFRHTPVGDERGRPRHSTSDGGLRGSDNQEGVQAITVRGSVPLPLSRVGEKGNPGDGEGERLGRRPSDNPTDGVT